MEIFVMYTQSMSLDIWK